MNKQHIKYWLYIDTYVHISRKQNSLLLYNTLTGKALEYKDQPEIFKLVKRMQIADNLQVMGITARHMAKPAILKFINDIRSYFIGDILEPSLSKGKPIQTMPIIRIQKDVDELKKDPSRSVGENMMDYLSEISLYVTEACGQGCRFCHKGYRQFLSCTARDRAREMKLSTVKELLNQLSGASLSRFNVLGGDIFSYSHFSPLAAVLRDLNIQTVFHTHYANIPGPGALLPLKDFEKAVLNILVPPPVTAEQLTQAVEALKAVPVKPRWQFMVTGEEDFLKADETINTLQLENPLFQPFYNGSNFEFFKENVFPDLESVLSPPRPMKDIYANKKANRLNFGRMSIMPMGKMYANVNHACLGIFGKETLYHAVYREMESSTSWRRVRDRVTPCRSCIFNALCPPVSNYNYAIGRNDLCHRYGEFEASTA